MAKGVFAFFVASIFLFALLSFAALVLEAKKPSFFVGTYKLAELEAFAVKRAIHDAAAEGAAKGILLALASGAEPYVEAKRGVHQALVELEQSTIQAGFPVKIWCGHPSFEDLSLASEEMEKLKEPVIPKNAHHISNSDCLKLIYVDLSRQSIHLSSFGFSVFLEPAGQGSAFLLPEDEEVRFDAANLSGSIFN
ncbi:MAG: hypothetical protein QXT25_00750 [Candidatus Anstonellaceae archaeon]